jgi:hypothetical protein
MHATRVLIVLAWMMISPLVAWAGTAPVRIWILPFRQTHADASLEHLQDALPALLAVAVSESGGDHVVVVERQRLNAVLAEQALTLADLVAIDTQQRVGRLLGATVLVSGSFAGHGSDVLVTMRAADLDTGLITATAEGRASTRQLGQLVGALYRRLDRDLDRRLPDLGPAQLDETPVANLHFMKGLGHYHGARYSHALAEFILAAEDTDLSDISRFWMANVYLMQERYTHACLELIRLTGRASSRVRASDVEARMSACERHVTPADMKMIRELAARQAPGTPGARAFVTVRHDPDEPHRFFGGRTVTMPLTIHVQERNGLAIRVQLVQLTTRLAMPAGHDITVPLPAHAATPSAVDLDLPLQLPAVERETDFELRFTISASGDPVPQPGGRIALKVYPGDLLAPVRAWAQSRPVRVEDDRGLVTAFLEDQRIPIAAGPGPRGVTIYAGTRALQKHSHNLPRDGETAVLFLERESDTPTLVVDRTGTGTIVQLEMRILERLPTDPLAQKILLDVFRRLAADHGDDPPNEGVGR